MITYLAEIVSLVALLLHVLYFIGVLSSYIRNTTTDGG
jgi:hypothetical protein